MVPGHGGVAEAPEVAARLAADHAYIDVLQRGEEPADARLGPASDWLSGPHQSNLEQAEGGRPNVLPRRTAGWPSAVFFGQFGSCSPDRIEQARAGLFATPAGPGADAAVLVMLGVALALLGAR